ncbi:GDSL-type esterase/lipase family protein [Ureaplasma zalophigenitalium]|uniref:GDSL-type esterase/lipase family protein n=1 Tax=Ureaplasma zalophigenitalium TaxID=907723 RepID=A0ABT3BPH1_9BACT|nr:GDSL-type esterase/lipase family protein [Ureaplasma zalophigenitalium]MCV3754093.1 GDSL-type esterase/lipase family protein [Ureaplasma zalophigenitalium]
MTKKKKIVSLGLAISLTATSLVAAAASCSKNNKDDKQPSIEENNENVETEKNQLEENKKDLINQIGEDNNVDDLKPNNNQKAVKPAASLKALEIPKQKINYLALGDSITAGFNDTLACDLAGELVDNKISGLSYPAFLIDYIQRLNPKAVANYDNAAITGSTVASWLYLLNDRDNEYVKGLEGNHLRFGFALDQNEHAKYKNRLLKYFDPKIFNDEILNSQEVLQATEKLTAKIKNANFITLTLGANDFILGTNFTGMIKEVVAQPAEIENIFAKYQPLFIQELTALSANLTKLVKILQKINPELKINLIGYPKPMLRWESIFNKLLNVRDQSNQIFSDFLFNGLNNAIATAAENTQVNFISVFDHDEWHKNKSVFTRSLFDIHPTELGYKKMAQDILLKLAINTSTVKFDPHEIANWTDEYINSDANKYNQQFYFSDYSNKAIIDLIVGHNNSGLWTKTNNENELINEQGLKYKNKTALVVKTWVLSHAEIIDQMLGFFQDVLKSLNMEDIVKKMEFLSHKDTEGHTNFFKLVKLFTENQVLDDVFVGIQEEIDEKAAANPNYDLTYQDFIEAFKNNLFRPQTLLRALKALLTSPVFIQNVKETKLIIKSVLKHFLGSELITKMFVQVNFKDNSHAQEITVALDTILKQVQSSETLNNIIDVLVTDLFDHTSIYYNFENLSELLATLVKNNKTQIANNLNTLSRELVENQGSREAILNMVKLTFNHDFGDILNNVHVQRILEKVLARLTSLTSFEKISDNIFEALTNTTFYDHVFQTKKNNLGGKDFNVFQIGLADLLNDLFVILSQEDISAQEFQKALITILSSQVVHDALNNGLIPLIIKIFKSGKFEVSNFLDQFISGLKQKNFTVDQKNHLKTVLISLIKTLFETPESDNLIKLVINYLINRFGDFLLKQNDPFLVKIRKDLFKVVDLGLNKIVPSEALGKLLTNLIANFIDFNEQFNEYNHWSNLLTTLIKINSVDLQQGITDIIGLLSKDPSVNQHLINILFSLIDHYVPLKNPVSTEVKQALTNIIKPLLTNISDLKTLALIQNKLFTLITHHLEALAQNPNANLENFKRDILTSVIELLPELTNLLELAEIKAIKNDDLMKVITFIVNELDWNQILQKRPNNDSNQAENSLSNKRIDVLDLVFQTLKKLLNSPYLNPSVPNASALVSQNQQKVKEIIIHIVQTVLSSTNLKQLLSEQIRSLLIHANLSIFKNDPEQQKIIINNLVNALFEKSDITKLLTKIIDQTFMHPEAFNQADNLLSMVSTLISQNQVELKTWITNLLNNLLNNDDILDFIFGLLIPLINKDKTWKDLAVADQNTLKNFVKKAIYTITNLDVFHQLIDQLFNLLSNPNNIQTLLSNNAGKFVEDLLTAVNLSTPQEIASLINNIHSNISAREYADVINTIVFKVRLNFTIKPKTTSEVEYEIDQPEKPNQATNFLTKLIQNLFAQDFKSSTGQKIKDTINFIFDDLKNEKIISHDERYAVFSGLLEQITYHSDPQINQQIKTLIKTAINDHALLDNMTNLFSVIINDLFDNHSEYGQIHGLEDIVHILFKNKKTALKDNIQKIIELFITNTKINESFVDLIFSLITKKLTEFAPQEITFFKQTIKKVLAHLPSLALYNNLFEKFFNLTEELFANLITNKPINAQPFIDLLMNNLVDFVEVFELVKYDDLSVDDFKNIIHIAITHLDQPQTPNNASDQKEPSIFKKPDNLNDFIFQILKKLAGLDLFNQQPGKIKTILTYLLDELFASKNFKTLLISPLLKNSTISKVIADLHLPTTPQTTLTNVADELFNADLKTILLTLINHFIDDHNELKNATDLPTLINTYASKVGVDLKNKIYTYIKNLATKSDIWLLAARIIIKQINPQFNVAETSLPVNRLANFLKNVVTNLDQLSLVDASLNEILKKLTDKASVQSYLEDSQSFIKMIMSLVDINNPKVAYTLLDILKNEKISAQDYSDLIFNIVFDVNIFEFIKKQKNQSTNSATDQQTTNYPDLIFKYINAFNHLTLEPSVQTKLLKIIDYLLAVLEPTHSYHNQLSDQLEVFYQQLIKNLSSNNQFIKTNESWFINVYNVLMKNQEINQALVNLMKNCLHEMIEHKSEYQSASDFNAYLSQFIQKNIANNKNAIKNFFVVIFNNLKNLQVFDLLIDQFPQIGDSLNATEKNELINYLDLVVKKIPELEFYKDNMDKLLELAQNNFAEFLDKNTTSLKNFWTTEFNQLNNWLNILQILTFEDLDVNVLENIFNIILPHIDVNKIINLLKSNTPANTAEIQPTNISQTLDLVFKILNNLSKNKYLTDSTVQKMRHLISKIIEGVMANSSVKNYFVNSISKMILNINLDSIFQLNQQQKTDLFNKLFERVYNDPNVQGLIVHLAQFTIENAANYQNQTNLYGLINYVFANHKEVLQNDINQIIISVLNDDVFSEQLSYIVFNVVTKKQPDQILHQNFVDLQTLIKAISQNLTKTLVYQKILGNVLDLCASNADVHYLQAMIEQEVNATKLFTQKILGFDPQTQYAALVADTLQILEIADLDVNVLTHGVVAVINEINWSDLLNRPINNENQPSTPKQPLSRVNDYYAYIHALLAYNLSPDAKNKGKQIVRTLVDVIQNKAMGENGFLINMFDVLSQQLANTITTQVPLLEPLKNDYQQLFAQIFQNKELVTDLTNELKRFVDKFIDDANLYAKVNGLGSLISEIIKLNKTEVISTLKKIISKHLRPNGSIIQALSEAFVKTTSVALKLPALSQDDHDKIARLITVFVPHIFDLQIVNKTLDEAIGFLQEHIHAIIDEDASFKDLFQQHFVEKVKQPAFIAEAIELVKYDQSNLIDFLDVLLRLIPYEKYKEIFDPVFLKTPDTTNEPNTSVPADNKDPLTQVFKTIAYILKTDVLKQQDNVLKLKATLKGLINKFLKSEPLSHYVIDVLQNKFTKTLVNKTGVSDAETRRFIQGAYSWFRDSALLQKILNSLIDDVFKYKNIYADLLMDKNYKEVLNNFIGHNYEAHLKQDIFDFVVDFVVAKPTTRFLALLMFDKLKLQNTNENDIEIVANFIVQVMKHIKEFDFLRKPIELIQDLFKEQKLATFEEANLKKISDIISRYITSDKTQFAKILAHTTYVHNDSKKIHVIYVANLINLIFEKSPLVAYENLSAEQPLYNGLHERNLVEKSFISEIIAKGQPPEGITGSDPLGALTTLSENMWKADEEFFKANPQLTFLDESPYYRAMFRLTLTVLWYAHETYFRNVTGGIWWNAFWSANGIGIVGKALSGKTKYGENRVWNNIFGDYSSNKSVWRFEQSYRDFDFIYFISCWRSQQRLRPEITTQNNHNKVNYIFESIKRGRPINRQKR